MSEPLHLQVDLDGVAVLTIDVPGQTVNVFTPQLCESLARAIERIRLDAEIVGMVITSGKDTGFLAGADIKAIARRLEQPLTPEQAMAFIAPAADVLRQLETCGKPVAVAINGSALGGGYEFCLACHYRVMEDRPTAVVGLPEVGLGLLPAGGGTQRLPRLIGIGSALPLLLTGRTMNAAQAGDSGLVDAVVPSGDAVPHARRWVLSQPDPRQPWDRPGYAIPDGAGPMAADAFAHFGLGTARVRMQTKDNYPAPLSILAVVYEGTQLPMDRALMVERRAFGELMADPTARNLIRTGFLERNRARKLSARPRNISPAPVKRLGILGAGMMGAGIAQVALEAGMEVALVDAGEEQLRTATHRLGRAWQRQGKDASGFMERLRAGTGLGLLADCDCVIEAIIEDSGAKAAAFRQLAEVASHDRKGFFLASNTSTLPIAGLAKHWVNPAQVIGMHFFSPVPRMALVEIIRADGTSEETLAWALDLAAQLRKTPIVVKDGPGFFTSRVFCAYIDEGMAMLAEGVSPALIENSAVRAGYAMPPLAVTDEVSLDLQASVIAQAQADSLPEQFLRLHAGEVIARMNALGRLGRKSSGGFYDFLEDGSKRLWPGLGSLYPVGPAQPDAERVRKRLLYIAAIESARCLEDRVVSRAVDADLGAVLGLGFPEWAGGPLSLIETVGAPVFVQECDAFADSHGERFRPSAWLRDSAADWSRLYV
ncbi:enoyl-CoA hydratase/isomerase family protein [Alcaligenaceae bacterium]|nr:enoyl-CoA hydratase/isomerase family protein [Alcaligenaceae bacterium]